jgi:dihydrofolate reductase
MRKLIMWNLLTLDGFFEGPTPWALDWHESVWGEELERLSIEQLRAAGGLLFGRVTYAGMAAYWSSASGEIAELMNALPKFVVSTTLASADWNNSRLLRVDVEAEVARLKQQPGQDLFVFGSAKLCATLMRSGLIDEYRLCLTPIVLGAGQPLFKALPEPQRMRLLEARALSSGGVLLRYAPAAEPTP